ncbi:Mce-associated membrane protein [Aeromicrobium sp. SORGH_AS981]|uniref:hypothetical protein n=1 Tax=Aeromicrobium sp. SORGH_AS_0981 TaxID=3041802 RepID=UPI00285E7AF7|nr:hypothetical protein [Aeromicrobium sp. SORGH_AS_0981]MDR6118639.1 Mce-associated membrane protein [Aeromicrobium sp. SORGH_AS_0981]
MSTPEGPKKRRRIAGESTPGAARPSVPAKKVVRRPVARPGAPVEPEPTPVDESTVEEQEVAQPTPPAAPRVAPRVGRRTGATADAAASTPMPTPAADERTDDPAAEPPESGSGTGTDVESGDAGGGAGRRALDPARIVLVGVAVLAVVFGAFFGYRGVADWRETHGVDGAHDKAAEAAASAAETIFTYRYDRIQQYLDDSSDVMTPSFAKDFESISPALRDLAPQRKIQVQATTRDSAAMSCGDDCRRDRATVLVFVDQARLADGSEVPTVFGNRVEMTMVERDGRWLVDDIKAL